MDRCDADQEGITLSPINQTRLIAEASARQVVIEHIGLCPFAKSDIEPRLRRLEINFGRLLGFMVGSGLIGGAAGGALIKALTN
jgi:hypothetical protein